MTSEQVFVLSTEGRDTGTPDNGSIPIAFGSLIYTDPFDLRLTSFNTVFSAPNVSKLRGNGVGISYTTSNVYTSIDTGSYSIGGSNDIGVAVATAITAACLVSGSANTVTASYNATKNRYSFTGTVAFKFISTSPNALRDLYTQIGIDLSTQTSNQLTQVGTKLPKLYENYFTVNLSADNSTTQMVKIATTSGTNAITNSSSFIVPRTSDYGEQLYLTMNHIAAQWLNFSRCPSRISWTLNRPDGSPLEQELDWTAVFSISRNR